MRKHNPGPRKSTYFYWAKGLREIRGYNVSLQAMKLLEIATIKLARMLQDNEYQWNCHPTLLCNCVFTINWRWFFPHFYSASPEGLKEKCFILLWTLPRLNLPFYLAKWGHLTKPNSVLCHGPKFRLSVLIRKLSIYCLETEWLAMEPWLCLA